MAWTGDSRAVLGRREAGGKCRTVSLTHDHKPINPAEASRIKAVGGRIERYAAHAQGCIAAKIVLHMDCGVDVSVIAWSLLSEGDCG